jgi:hypothetical protein
LEESRVYCKRAAWRLFIDGLDIDEIIEVSKASWMSTSGRCCDQDLFKQAVKEVVGTLHDKESESRVLTSRRLGLLVEEDQRKQAVCPNRMGRLTAFTLMLHEKELFD